MIHWVWALAVPARARLVPAAIAANFNTANLDIKLIPAPSCPFPVEICSIGSNIHAIRRRQVPSASLRPSKDGLCRGWVKEGMDVDFPVATPAGIAGKWKSGGTGPCLLTRLRRRALFLSRPSTRRLRRSWRYCDRAWRAPPSTGGAGGSGHGQPSHRGRVVPPPTPPTSCGPPRRRRDRAASCATRGSRGPAGSRTRRGRSCRPCRTRRSWAS